MPVREPRSRGFRFSKNRVLDFQEIIHNCPLKGIGVRDFYKGSVYGIFMLCNLFVVFNFIDVFFIFEAFLRQLSVVFGLSVLA